jgi:hypothetical protein
VIDDVSPFRLSRVQRNRIASGDPPRISGDGPCPLEAGDEVQVAPLLVLRVEQVRRKAERWTLRYMVIDRRDPVRLLRRTPPAARNSTDTDEFGVPRPPTPDAIKDAAEASAYSSQPSSLSDAGEAIERKVQDRYAAEGTQKTVRRLAEQRARHEARELSDRLRDLERAHSQGEDVGLQLAAVRRAIERAERKRDRKAA